jgi:hypothetical protein
MTNPRQAAIGIGESNGLWVAVFGRACPPGSEAACALTGDYGDKAAASPPEAESPTDYATGNVSGEPFVGSYPAKLKVRRAGVEGGRLDVLARITTRADGESVGVEFHANGYKHRFTAKVKDGTVRFNRRLPSRQSRVRSGIITITFKGNDRVYPAKVRMRAANGQAKLARTEPTLKGGLLTAGGSLTTRASGVVRLSFIWQNDDGSMGERNWTARPSRGRFNLSESVPAAAACRGGYLTIAFTGDLNARGGPVRGELDAKQVRPISC